MPRCHVCGETELARACHHCQETVCNAHTLPENHDCEGILISIPARQEKSTHQKRQRKPQSKTADELAENYCPGTGSDSGPDVNPDGSIAGEQTQPLPAENPMGGMSFRERMKLRIRKDGFAVVVVVALFALLLLI